MCLCVCVYVCVCSRLSHQIFEMCEIEYFADCQVLQDSTQICHQLLVGWVIFQVFKSEAWGIGVELVTAVSCSAYAGYLGGEMFKSRLNTKDVKKLVTMHS